MERIAGYLKGKEKHELIINKPRSLKTVAYVDASRYVECADTRRSSMGDIQTVGGAIVSWSSKRQKTLSLSSTEAEYVALTDAGKERKCIQEMWC